MSTHDKEISILEILKSQPELGQRELAKAIGASLGMTNTLLKRLAAKGWVVIRKVNARNLSYILTPDGVNEFARRSYSYFKRTIKNVREYKNKIDSFVAQVKADGYTGITLIGESDLDFLVENAAEKCGLAFSKVEASQNAVDGSFGLAAETVTTETKSLVDVLG